jgi:hypothetical protein
MIEETTANHSINDVAFIPSKTDVINDIVCLLLLNKWFFHILNGYFLNIFLCVSVEL